VDKRKIEKKGKKTPVSSNKITVLSPDQRRAQGKALRDKVPRSTHAGWTSPADRRDPIDILIESNRGRVPELIPIRFGRMLESPFAFFRGSAAIMAAVGGVATPERQINFDINDFDETLPAPWEWDLKRLAASIVIAARHLELSESAAAKATRASARAYRERMMDYSSMRALDIWYDRVTLDDVLAEAPNEEVRTRIMKRIQKAQESSSSEVIFLKLAEFDGEQSKTIPRSYSMSFRKLAKGSIIKQRWQPIATHYPNTSDGSLIGSSYAMSQPKLSAWEALAPAASSLCLWPLTTPPYFCRSRRLVHPSSNPMQGKASMPTMASALGGMPNYCRFTAPCAPGYWLAPMHVREMPD